MIPRITNVHEGDYVDRYLLMVFKKDTTPISVSMFSSQETVYEDAVDQMLRFQGMFVYVWYWSAEREYPDMNCTPLLVVSKN